MGDLFEWLRTAADHPLIKGSVFHYEFEYIHPFDDGNGRTGRLWHSLILRKWRPVFAWMPVETIIHRRQQEYYDALQMSGNLGDSTVFVEFMLGAICDALASVKAQQASDGQAIDKRLEGDREALTARRQKLILEAVRERGRIRMTDIAELLRLSSQRARVVVGEMVSAGLLAKHGNRRYTFYSLPDDTEVYTGARR